VTLYSVPSAGPSSRKGSDSGDSGGAGRRIERRHDRQRGSKRPSRPKARSSFTSLQVGRVSTFVGDLAANGLTCAARQLSPSSFGEQMPRFRADFVPLLCYFVACG